MVAVDGGDVCLREEEAGKGREGKAYSNLWVGDAGKGRESSITTAVS